MDQAHASGVDESGAFCGLLEATACAVTPNGDLHWVDAYGICSMALSTTGRISYIGAVLASDIAVLSDTVGPVAQPPKLGSGLLQTKGGRKGSPGWAVPSCTKEKVLHRCGTTRPTSAIPCCSTHTCLHAQLAAGAPPPPGDQHRGPDSGPARAGWHSRNTAQRWDCFSNPQATEAAHNTPSSR